MVRTQVLLFICCLFAVAGHAQDMDVSGGLIFEGEPFMIISPTNPDHMVVAWMGVNGASTNLSIKCKVSDDGGTTWSSASVIPHQSGTFTSADPSMAYDHFGNLYLSYIDYRQSPDSGGVYVVKSTDGGSTWGTPALVIGAFADGTKYPIDRPWLTIQQGGGSTPDTLYETTKPASWVPVPNRPYFTYSSDGGATWSHWQYIDDTGWRVGNIIAAPMAAPSTDSAGTFRCVYPSYYPPESIYPRYVMAMRTPSSSSFSYKDAYTVVGSTPVDTLAKAGHRFICDPANNNHFALFTTLNLYGDMDILCNETFDGGSTWSGPTRVNDDSLGNGKMQDLVWSNFDRSGNMVVAWRDRRNAPGTGYQQPSEIWGTVKWKDSSTFSPNFRISDTIVAYDSFYLSRKGNDFMNVAIANDTLSTIWGDVRTGVLNIWFTRRDLHTGGGTGIRKIISESLPTAVIFPNPATNVLNVSATGIKTISLYDEEGKLLMEQTVASDNATIDMQPFPEGNYLLSLMTAEGVLTKKIIKQ
jgi:Secretion system C-terminal sorting domain